MEKTERTNDATLAGSAGVEQNWWPSTGGRKKWRANPQEWNLQLEKWGLDRLARKPRGEQSPGAVLTCGTKPMSKKWKRWQKKRIDSGRRAVEQEQAGRARGQRCLSWWAPLHGARDLESVIEDRQTSEEKWNPCTGEARSSRIWWPKKIFSATENLRVRKIGGQRKTKLRTTN
jgi:hypothetical protein